MSTEDVANTSMTICDCRVVSLPTKTLRCRSTSPLSPKFGLNPHPSVTDKTTHDYPGSAEAEREDRAFLTRRDRTTTKERNGGKSGQSRGR
jgi:hypothetical protein